MRSNCEGQDSTSNSFSPQIITMATSPIEVPSPSTSNPALQKIYSILQSFPRPYPKGSLCTTPSKALEVFVLTLLSLKLGLPLIETGPSIPGFARAVKVAENAGRETLALENVKGWVVGGVKKEGSVTSTSSSVKITVSSRTVFAATVETYVNVVALEKAVSRDPSGVGIPMYLINPGKLVGQVEEALKAEGLLRGSIGGGGNKSSPPNRKSPDSEWEVMDSTYAASAASASAMNRSQQPGTFDPLREQRTYFDQDLNPTFGGGVRGVGGGRGGNLLGPDAPIFQPGNRGNPLQGGGFPHINGAPGGFGFDGDGLMRPRFDPINPPGVGPGGGRGRGRGGGMGRGGQGFPNNDLHKPPGLGDMGDDMYM